LQTITKTLHKSCSANGSLSITTRATSSNTRKSGLYNAEIPQLLKQPGYMKSQEHLGIGIS